MPYNDLTYGSIIYAASVSEDSGSTWTALTGSSSTYWLKFYSANLTLEGTPATALNAY